MRFTPPRRASLRMAGLVIPWMLSFNTLRERAEAPLLPTPSDSFVNFSPFEPFSAAEAEAEAEAEAVDAIAFEHPHAGASARARAGDASLRLCSAAAAAAAA
mmetsp:Transcript_14812/g.38390  ORF Transcript_14812/g.38390 Transcript_14812/m.38390 type:complete len:102 (+) Transcript_14812:288-593(+)